MKIGETVVVPKDTMMDFIHCMEVMLLIIANSKNVITEEDLSKIRYCNKIFLQAMNLFNELQTQLNQKK